MADDYDDDGDGVDTIPLQQKANSHLLSKRILDVTKDDSKILRRTKRGWMWNQFFLLEEYTGTDTQYVGKTFEAASPLPLQKSGVSAAMTRRTIQEKAPSRHPQAHIDSRSEHYHHKEASCYFFKGGSQQPPPQLLLLQRQLAPRVAATTTMQVACQYLTELVQGKSPEELGKKKSVSSQCPLRSNANVSKAHLVLLVINWKVKLKVKTFGHPNIENKDRTRELFFSTSLKLHTDQDKGDGNLKYILTGDGAGSLFVIDENTGDIHAAKKLDREEKSLYILRAKAIDRKTGRQVEPESEFIIKIHDINDNEPKFTKDLYTASVPEMSGVGTSVIQVTATDADDANYGNSAKVVYSILQGQPYFSVDPESGIIKTALPDMSRENREQYQVVIQAKDMGGQMGGLSGTTTVNITLTDVNNNPPRFPQSTYQFNSPESVPLGTHLGRIKANDPDVGENAEMEYSIAEGDGTDMFDVITDKETQEGIITVKQNLDFENKMLYTLRVDATNTHPDPRFLHLGPFKDTAVVKISVEDIDEPPVFSKISYLIEVDEDVKEGSIIGQVTAYDPDSMNNLINFPPLGPVIGYYLCYFQLSALIHVHDRQSAEEYFGWYGKPNSCYSIFAKRINNPKQSSHIPVFIRILDINDHAPEFAMYYETFVCENAKPGQIKLVVIQRVYYQVLIFLLIVLVVLFTALKRQRKKEPLIISKDDVRDNIVTYNDEGGGEEDTQAFDIGTLRNPEAREDSKLRRDVMPETIFQIRRTVPLWENIDVQDFIHRRLKENDSDPSAPPYDSLATYAYEGDDSVADSLSSLESLTADCNQDYDYLSDWGPRFKKLADMYGGDDSDRD
ncbi:PREDICTED: cadherin-9-like [Galeopterus variegatus]|uniref:Cadherin-9-like n=2 Tax=Euarchontoglires TaxID=314146 RepID=A0ABM0S2H1_GALVR|nr:PREDICTED: cadherin-9-like [Galeopterus variegatus]